MIVNKRFITAILLGDKPATVRAYSPKRALMSPGREYTLQSGCRKGGVDNFARVRCTAAVWLKDIKALQGHKLEMLGQDKRLPGFDDYADEFYECYPGYDGGPVIYYEWQLLEDLTNKAKGGL